jgi:hypothetical protein
MATEEGETTAAAAGQQEADGQQQATGMATIPEGTIANSPELIALLNPALARAMLPDGITPDHMTRLKHAMARDYGYIGPWDGWSASMRMRGVTQMDVRPDLVGPNAKFYVLYHCPGKPACRSMNDVAKALGFQVKRAPCRDGDPPFCLHCCLEERHVCTTCQLYMVAALPPAK